MPTEAEFWVAIAFLVFASLVWWVGGFGSLTSGLDARAKRIRGELEEAKRLREEAAGMLDDYKRRRTEAEAEAQAIVAGARAEAERIAQEAHARMEEFVARRTAAAEAKIAQAETQAAAEVRAAAADAAVRVSETVLRQQLSGDAGQELVGRGLSEVRRKLQ